MLLNFAITQLLCRDKTGRVQGGRCDGRRTLLFTMKVFGWEILGVSGSLPLYDLIHTKTQTLLFWTVCSVKETDAFKASESFIKLSSLCTSEMH